MPESYTPRGFAVYASGIDRTGESWSAQESSIATERCVWVGNDRNRAHLTEDQARVLRNALDEFLEGGANRG